MPTNGSRNRNAGHAWEREGVKDFLPMFPEVATSRAVNRGRDNLKVDLAYGDEHKHGRFPYNMQYKSYSRPIAYPQLLSEMPQGDPEFNVIAHRQTEKAESGRFMVRGKFAIMNYGDFLKMVAYRRGYEILYLYSGHLPTEMRIELDQRLKEIGL